MRRQRDAVQERGEEDEPPQVAEPRVLLGHMVRDGAVNAGALANGCLEERV